MTDKYILIDRKAVKEPDLLKWGRWLETADRIVGQTEIGESRVSTVFLGLDHAYGGGEPLLFETMVFDGALDGEQERCTTWEQAEEMHERMCEQVRNISKP